MHKFHKRGDRPRRGGAHVTLMKRKERKKKTTMKVISNGNSGEAELETKEVQNNRKKVTFYRGK